MSDTNFSVKRYFENDPHPHTAYYMNENDGFKNFTYNKNEAKKMSQADAAAMVIEMAEKRAKFLKTHSYLATNLVYEIEEAKQ